LKSKKAFILIQSSKQNSMKNKMKQLFVAAAVVLFGNAAFAQVNLNLNSTTSAVTKATVSTTKVADVVSKTTQATTRVVNATGKVVQTTANVATRTTANVAAKTNAATNATLKSSNAKVTNETAIDARLKTETNLPEQGKGISADVKELVVAEAQGIRTTTKELRNDVKPGLNISSNTNANAQSEVNSNNASANGEINSNTEVKTDAKATAEEMKQKAEAKAAEAKKNVKSTVKKVKKTKVNVNAEASASSNSAVSTGRQ
jgi:hypothetical protein